MKKGVINAVFILFMVLPFSVYSQELIAVQNGGNPTFYEDLNLAITNAQAGDTLYIPGKSYAISNTINKKLHLVGVGHHPDSTSATNRTIISSVLKLDVGADFGSLHGIYFSASSNKYSTTVSMQITGKVTGYTISNCYFKNGFGTIEAGDPQRFLIKNNIINKILFYFDGNANNILNNIFLGTRSDINGSKIRNNIFLVSYNSYEGTYGLRVINSLVENNIFINNALNFKNLENNIFKNNLNGGLNGVNSYGNQGSGNFIDELIDLTTVFSNYNGTFNESTSDFHLINDSPYKNAGRDGTDIGIYGGAFPWKDGSIPFNPHIQIKQIAPATNMDGNLQIKIQVQAQEN